MALTVRWSIGQQSVDVQFPQADAQQVVAALRRYVAAHRLVEDASATAPAELVRLTVRHQMARLRQVAVQSELEAQQAEAMAAAQAAVGFNDTEE
jgi:hypothetical protein